MYETHITLEPLDPFDDEQHSRLQFVCKLCDFKPARLLHQKGVEGASIDAFVTGHSERFYIAIEKCKEIVTSLYKAGFMVKRYKIENVMVDSRDSDDLGLL